MALGVLLLGLLPFGVSQEAAQRWPAPKLTDDN
jgi:hypothetical protein